MVCLLVVVGLGIIVSEIFIPSAGMLSILALGCFCGSAFCAYRAWYEPGHVTTFWVYVVCMVLGIPAFIGTGLWLLPKTALGNQLLAAPQDLESLTPFQEEEKRLTGLIDECGYAITLFSPGGMVQIGRDRFHAESEGLMIDPQTEVIVVGTKGNRLLVRPVALHQTVDRAEKQTATESGGEDAPVADARSATEPGDSLLTEESSAEATTGKSELEIFPIDFDIPDTV
jgi:membrane-bound serine protease (ClpP class)